MNGTWKAIVKYRAFNLNIRETDLFSIALKWFHIRNLGMLELREGPKRRRSSGSAEETETQRGRHNSKRTAEAALEPLSADAQASCPPRPAPAPAPGWTLGKGITPVAGLPGAELWTKASSKLRRPSPLGASGRGPLTWQRGAGDIFWTQRFPLSRQLRGAEGNLARRATRLPGRPSTSHPEAKVRGAKSEPIRRRQGCAAATGPRPSSSR